MLLDLDAIYIILAKKYVARLEFIGNITRKNINTLVGCGGKPVKNYIKLLYTEFLKKIILKVILEKIQEHTIERS